METITSSIIDRFSMSRSKATVITFLFSLIIGLIVCFGYNIWYADIPLPNGSTGQILDVLDYISNSIMLPIVALLTSILIGWICKPEYVTEEVEKGIGNKKFTRKTLYIIMIKFVSPILLILILLQAFNTFGFLDK